MELGIIYPHADLRAEPDSTGRLAVGAEELGFESFVIYDHVLGAERDREPALTGPYDVHDTFHDPFVVFAYLAALTTRLTLETGIMILPQRQTALVAKQAADLDRLSGGRLRLGVGVGWNYVEYDALGETFSTRGARMDEQIGLLRQLWSEEVVNFTGRFDRIDRAGLGIFPSRPIPIWCGGSSDPAFRRAARIADGFIIPGQADQFSVLTRLRQLLGEEGRDESTFSFQVSIPQPDKTTDDIVSELHAWREAGGTHAAIGSMKRGFTDVDQHLDFHANILARWG